MVKNTIEKRKLKMMFWKCAWNIFIVDDELTIVSALFYCFRRKKIDLEFSDWCGMWNEFCLTVFIGCM